PASCHRAGSSEPVNTATSTASAKMIVGYCRIGQLEHADGLDYQQRRLAGIGAEKFFCERAGLFGRAPELERAIEFAKKGDLIAITKPYRVGHSASAVM